MHPRGHPERQCLATAPLEPVRQELEESNRGLGDLGPVLEVESERLRRGRRGPLREHLRRGGELRPQRFEGDPFADPGARDDDPFDLHGPQELGEDRDARENDVRPVPADPRDRAATGGRHLAEELLERLDVVLVQQVAVDAADRILPELDRRPGQGTDGAPDAEEAVRSPAERLEDRGERSAHMLTQGIVLPALRWVVVEEPLREPKDAEREADGVVKRAFADLGELERAAAQVADEVIRKLPGARDAEVGVPGLLGPREGPERHSGRPCHIPHELRAVRRVPNGAGRPPLGSSGTLRARTVRANRRTVATPRTIASGERLPSDPVSDPRRGASLVW